MRRGEHLHAGRAMPPRRGKGRCRGHPSGPSEIRRGEHLHAGRAGLTGAGVAREHHRERFLLRIVAALALERNRVRQLLRMSLELIKSNKAFDGGEGGRISSADLPSTRCECRGRDGLHVHNASLPWHRPRRHGGSWRRPCRRGGGHRRWHADDVAYAAASAARPAEDRADAATDEKQQGQTKSLDGAIAASSPAFRSPSSTCCATGRSYVPTHAWYSQFASIMILSALASST